NRRGPITVSSSGRTMDTVTRAKNICLSPSTEWAVIAEEQTPAASLIAGYVAPLAAIGAVAGIIGGSLVGISVPFGGTYRVPLTLGVARGVFTVVVGGVGGVVFVFFFYRRGAALRRAADN